MENQKMEFFYYALVFDVNQLIIFEINCFIKSKNYFFEKLNVNKPRTQNHFPLDVNQI